MFVRQLQYLVAVAREGHFGRAASMCQVSQPTLSAGIRRLEEELGLPLVIRSHRFLGLTAEGERVLAWARRMVADYDGLRRELSGTVSGLSGQVRVGAVAATVPTVSALLHDFCASHPAVRVQLLALTADGVQRSLDGREVDVAVTLAELVPLQRVRGIALRRESYVAVSQVAAEARDSITWAEVAAQPLCLPTGDTVTRQVIDSVFSALGLAPEPRLEVSDLVGLWAQLRAGGWTGIAPESCLETLGLPAGLAAVPLVSPERHSTVGLLMSDREPAAPLAAALLAHAEAAIVRPAAASTPLREPELERV
ncbi:LysR family transcriptional regulator [Xanthobacter sp. ZOL 2024]